MCDCPTCLAFAKEAREWAEAGGLEEFEREVAEWKAMLKRDYEEPWRK